MFAVYVCKLRSISVTPPLHQRTGAMYRVIFLTGAPLNFLSTNLFTISGTQRNYEPVYMGSCTQRIQGGSSLKRHPVGGSTKKKLILNHVILNIAARIGLGATIVTFNCTQWVSSPVMHYSRQTSSLQVVTSKHNNTDHCVAINQ